jgi:hypothetical protein
LIKKTASLPLAPQRYFRVGEVRLVDAKIVEERQCQVGDVHQVPNNTGHHVFVVVPAVPVRVLSATPSFILKLDSGQRTAVVKQPRSGDRCAAVYGKDIFTSCGKVFNDRRLVVGDILLREPQCVHNFMNSSSNDFSQFCCSAVGEVLWGKVGSTNDRTFAGRVEFTVARPRDGRARSRRSGDIKNKVCIGESRGRVSGWNGVKVARRRAADY